MEDSGGVNQEWKSCSLKQVKAAPLLHCPCAGFITQPHEVTLPSPTLYWIVVSICCTFNNNCCGACCREFSSITSVFVVYLLILAVMFVVGSIVVYRAYSLYLIDGKCGLCWRCVEGDGKYHIKNENR